MQVSDLGLLVVTGIMWCAGLIMFLLPPIPGVPGELLIGLDSSNFAVPCHALYKSMIFFSLLDTWRCAPGSWPRDVWLDRLDFIHYHGWPSIETICKCHPTEDNRRTSISLYQNKANGWDQLCNDKSNATGSRSRRPLNSESCPAGRRSRLASKFCMQLYVSFC